jgi:hypothetical protein
MLKLKRLSIRLYSFLRSNLNLLIGIKNLILSKIHLLSKHNLHNVKFVEGNFLKIAIVALYPEETKLYTKSLENLLVGLVDNKVHPILVINNHSLNPELQKIIDMYDCSLILRKNFGRDFGAYQCGVLTLARKKSLKKLDRLFLINDTLIWRENSSRIIRQTSLDEFQSIWLNLERNVHAHSFFLSFSNGVIANPNFLKFWNRYIPSNSRNHAIHKGENQLTNVLLRSKFTCKPLVTPKFIEKALVEYLENNINAFGFARTIRLGFLWPGNPPFADVKRSLEDNLYVDLEEKNWVRQISSFGYSDAPHRLALVLEVCRFLPLKRDLFKFYSLQEIEEVLEFSEHPFKESLLDYYLQRSQNHQASNPKTKLMRSLGEI